TGELEQAVRIFQKTLEMDPENVAMKVRLAEVYVRLGKKNEAWQIFSSAAEQLRTRGQLVPAEDILQRMLTLDPKNNQVLLLRGKNALEAGDSAGAINYFQQVPDIDTQPEALKALFQAYLAADRLSDAGMLATKLLTIHNDIEGIAGFVGALLKGGLFQDALNFYHQYGDRLMVMIRPRFWKTCTPSSATSAPSPNPSSCCSNFSGKPARPPTSAKSPNCWRTPACKRETWRRRANCIRS